MSPIPDDPNQAQAWISGEAPDQTIDFYIPRGNRGPQGLQGPIGPSLLVGTVETNTGPAVPGTQGPQGLTGPKGDPGGLANNTDLLANDLDLITTQGMYVQPNSASATAANHYPYVGFIGLIMCLNRAPGRMTQIAWPNTGAGNIERTQYIRTQTSTGWGAWYSMNTTRIDNTAGRAIYQWDNLNGREQLIYGDTGERDITASLASGTAGAVKVRRYGNTVEVKFVGWQPGNVVPSQLFLTGQELPVGFRPNNSVEGSGFDASGNAFRRILFGANTGQGNIYGQPVNGNIGFTIAFQTIQNWPTVLPGIAVAGNTQPYA